MKFYILLFFTFLSTLSFGNEAKNQFNAANDAYQAGNYQQAIELYEGLVTQEYRSVGVFYNLGNAYLKNDQLGLAILNYERALHLRPRHRDARYNLAIAKEMTIDEIVPLPSFFLARWWRGIRDSGSSGLWGVFTILFLVVGFGGISLWLLGETRQHKKIGFWGGIAGLVLAFFFLSLGFDKKSKEKNNGFAIVLEKEMTLRVSPDALASEVIQLHEGTKIELLDQIGTWYKVQLANGEEGWLPKDGMEKI